MQPATQRFPEEKLFSRAELERRLRRTQSETSARGLDAIITSSPSNIFYLTGHHSVNLWDTQFLIVPATGTPIFVLWQFELGRFSASGQMADPVMYATGDDPLVTTLHVLDRLGLTDARLGIDVSTPYFTVQSYQSLSRLLPKARLEHAPGVVESVRILKSDEELTYIREAARITDLGMSAALDAVREGVLDNEVAATATAALMRAGSELMCIDPIVAAGYRSGLAHSSFCGKRIDHGESVFVELGACVHRYTAPLMRTAVAGQPSEQLMRLADASLHALDAVISAMKPGAAAAEVADAGKRAIAPVESEVAFHYVFGYSVGAGFPPSWLEESNFYLRSDNQLELTSGMVFHLPMTLRVFGQYGVGFSETVLVTQQGAEPLTRTDRRLVIRRKK